MKKLILFLSLLPFSAVAQTIMPAGSGSATTTATSVATAGAVALTNQSGETNITSLKIPANSVGPNGTIWVSCLWTYTNSSNAKTLTIRYTNTAGSVSGGVIGSALSATTTAAAQTLNIIRSNNSTTAQLSWAQAGNTPFNTGAAAPATPGVDTTQDSFININGTLALTSETITVQHCQALIYNN